MPRRDKVGGGAAAYPGRNGDTAKPRGHFIESDNPDHVQDWERLKPYDRAHEDGHIIRVETDGNGHLIEFVETSTGDVVWGDTRGSWQTMREAAPDPTFSSRRNSAAYWREIKRRSAAIMDVLEAEGPHTIRALAGRLDETYARVEIVMRKLDRSGQITRCGQQETAHGPPETLWRFTHKLQDGKHWKHERGRRYKRQVRDCLREFGTVTTALVTDATGVPPKKVRQWLRRLVVEGVAEELGPAQYEPGQPIYWRYTGGST